MAKDNSAPEFHLFDYTLLDNLSEDDELALPWAHVFADTNLTYIWRETESAWGAITLGGPTRVPPAPLLLLAHPYAATLAGSGEAIYWLENWRLEDGVWPREEFASSVVRRSGSKRAAGESPDEHSPKKARTSFEDTMRKVGEAENKRSYRLGPSTPRKPKLERPGSCVHGGKADNQPEFVEGSSTPRKTKKAHVLEREVIDLTLF